MPDLNLLIALDVLIEEGSVVGAARRMNLSAPAMSRTLARIRAAVGDPVLVRSGRGLTPTPRALQLREQVRGVIEQAHAVFNAGREVDLSTLERTFSVRANDVFIAAYRSRLREAFRTQAPKAVLRFVPESDVDDDAMAQGRIDLYISSARQFGADIKVQNLFNISCVGLAHEDHPIFAEQIDARRFAACEQIAVSRRGRMHGPIDDALDALGLKRRVALIVPTFHAAIFAAADADLMLPQMPRNMLGEMNRMGLRLRTFELPVSLQAVVFVQAWHPRLDHDPAHRWLRRTIKAQCEADSGGLA